MSNQDPNDTGKDYVGSGGGTDTEAPAVIGTEEELAKLLESQGLPPAGENNDSHDEPQLDDEGNPIEGAEKPDGAGEEEEQAVEYASPIHYLDDRFKLNLNLENYPEDTSVEDSMQAVGDMFERVVKNANTRIAEYKATVDALEDAEVKAFIEAKKGGKTMQDFVQQYAASPDGMADEALVRQDLQRSYPKFSNEQISDLLSSYKDRDMIESMATGIRERWKDAEAAKQRADEQKAEQDRVADEQRRNQEVVNYKAFLDSRKDVYGVPISDDMRQEAFAAATQPIDEEGNTFLDKALQSDEGVFLATLGIIHLQRMLQAKGTVLGNRQNKSLLDRLSQAPDALQGGGTQDKVVNDFNADVANMF